MEPKIIKIKTIKSLNGDISIIDRKNNLPFEIKRFFMYIIFLKIQREVVMLIKLLSNLFQLLMAYLKLRQSHKT